MDMKEQRFGVEVEMTGITRKEAAEIAASHFGTVSHYDGTFYATYSALDEQNRKWKFTYDSSITAQRKVGRTITAASDEYKTEMVTPICRYEDIETIQELVRKLRAAGAIVNNKCGIHIHIDASPYNAGTLRNITNIMASKEDLIYKAMQVEVARERQYCRKVEQSFLDEINRKKPHTLDEVSRIWYNGRDGRSEHYHDSRYHCLNLHSVFQKGTIEFRLFNSTTHAGKIKAYIQLCLAISAQALNQRCASRQKTKSSNEKYTFRTWLLRLGLIGDEYKTARLHLLEHLDGCIAWKDPAQALQQKERLRQKKEKELAEAAQAASQQQEQTIENEQEQTGAEEESPGLSMSM
ncbi:Putative amidoligase enzyme [Clostridium sp. C105KSO15]|nr:Putative amidoligase enzyme [Clostridium sp. C105KSO15]